MDTHFVKVGHFYVNIADIVAVCDDYQAEHFDDEKIAVFLRYKIGPDKGYHTITLNKDLAEAKKLLFVLRQRTLNRIDGE